MRNQSARFMEKVIADHGPFNDVLEVGSADVNGNVRNLFEGCNYIGTDMQAGNNVDIVVNGHDLKEHFKDKEFDLVFSFDTFEHDDKFWETMEQMKQVTKPGGWIVIGAPGRNCPLHEHPGDYWRFMPQGIQSLMEGLAEVEIDAQHDEAGREPEDEIYAKGRKP